MMAGNRLVTPAPVAPAADAGGAGGRPLISIVSPCYDEASYEPGSRDLARVSAEIGAR